MEVDAGLLQHITGSGALFRKDSQRFVTFFRLELDVENSSSGKARAGTPSKSSRIAAGIDVALLEEDLAQGLEDILDDARASEKRRPNLNVDSDIELMVDNLHAAVHRSATLTEQAASTLDALFGALSARMQAAPGLLAPSSLSSTTTNPSSQLLSMITVGDIPAKTKAAREPMDLMRALARTDATRPRQDPATMSSSARELRSGAAAAAKKGKEGVEEGEGRRERRVTAVGTNAALLRTPRRTVPGTPRRKGG